MIQALAARHAGLKTLIHPAQAASFVAQAGGGQLLRRPPPCGHGLAITPLRERRLHTRQGLWLAAEQQPEGSGGHVDAGREARDTLRRDTPRQEGRHSARRAALADQARRAVDLHPHVQTALLASSMLAGLAHALPDILDREAPGVAHGLQLLKLKPDDAVAECDPGDLALPVRLALLGCRVTLMHGDILTSARLWDEVAAYGQGTPRGMARQRPDGQPWLSPADYSERAKAAASRLNVYSAPDWQQLPGQGTWRALLSRGRLAFAEAAEATEEIRTAARLLSPGGGLLFRLAHAAGDADPANAGWTRRQLQLGALEDVARSHGLNLRCAHVTFNSPGVASGTLLAPRQVAAECSGWVDFHNVDAAAWNGWIALKEDPWVRQHPMTVEVSGMLERMR